MKALDRAAIERCGIPSLILMENAGRGISDLAKRMIDGKRKNILVICGKGNNGGDGFVSARHLSNRGFKVKVFLLGNPADLTSDAKTNCRIVKKMGIPVIQKSLSRLKILLKQANLIIDAIFGVGLTRPVEGIYREAISLINSCRKPVLAVDIPSGLDSDKGKVLGIAVRAKMTGTLGAAKRGLFLNDGPACSGKVKIIDISIPRKLISMYTT
jgi:NAD(P)H-hydrate epimerase